MPKRIKDLTELCSEAAREARKQGFYSEKQTIEGMIAYLALVSSEISEAIDAIQRDDTVETRKQLNDEILQLNTESFDNKQLFESYFHNTLEDELADAVLRIFSFCGAYHLDLETALERKMEYNKLRPKNRHGKRF